MEQPAPDKARQIGLGRATQSINAMMVEGAPVPPGDVSFIRQLSGDMSFDEFAQTYGLDTESPRARGLYQRITGRSVGVRLSDDYLEPGMEALGRFGTRLREGAATVVGWASRKKKPAQGQAKATPEPDPFA